MFQTLQSILRTLQCILQTLQFVSQTLQFKSAAKIILFSKRTKNLMINQIKIRNFVANNINKVEKWLVVLTLYR